MPRYRRTDAPRRWRLPRATLALALGASVLAFGAPVAHAVTYTVTKTADTNDGTCDGDCSLREAIRAANANSGPDVVTLPAGTYALTLSGNDDTAAGGDLDVTDAIAINGAGSGVTTIDGLDADRVFDVAPIVSCVCAISFSGVTITNGSANPTNFNVGGAIYIGTGPTVTISDSVISSSTATGTGGGIEARGASLSLSGVTLQGNDALAGGGALRSIGNLSITSSTFSDNEAEFGGAIALAQDSTKTVTITGTRFSGNDAVATAGGAADDGGAIHANVDTTVTLTGNTFTGNAASGNGGAISFADDQAVGSPVGGLVARYNRIVGNTAAAGSGISRVSGTVSAENDWWGCNAGPGSAPCDRILGTIDADPWLVLTHTANPASISTGGTSTLTAGFLTNSAGSAIAAGDLGALVGTPITFGSAVLGTISSAAATIQSTGTASATYTAGSTGGAGSATATVDAQSASAAITITRASTSVSSLDADGASPTAASTVSWTATFADPVSGLTAGNFVLVTGGGLSGPQITSVSAPSGAPATSWTISASTGTGAGTLGLDLANDTGVSRSLSNLTFTGDVYTVDRAAPTTSITANPTNPSSSSAASFSFTGADTGVGLASFECRLDAAGSFSPCTSPASYTDLTDGSHTFQVRAVDGVGNVDASPASYTWLVDTAGPDTTITVSPANPSASASASFSFTGSDGGTGVAGFECHLDAATFASCTSPMSYTGLTDGSHTFEVRAVDGSGIVDATPATSTWTVDTLAPGVSVDQAAGQADPTGASPIRFTVAFTEPVSGFSSGDVGLGGTAGATTAVVTRGPVNYEVAVSGMTANGTVVASVASGVAQDAAGNLNSAGVSTDATVTYVADGTAPDTTITGAPEDPTNSTSATFSFTGSDDQTPPGSLSFECQLDAGSFSACSSPVSYSALGAGSHTFQVRAIDALGNVDATPASTTWTIDTTAPSVTINQAAGQSDPTTSSPISFTVAFDEPVTGFAGADVVLTGTAGATTATVTGGPMTYQVSVSGMTGDGTVIATVPVGVAADAAGNGNSASTSADNTVTFIANGPPSAALTGGRCSSTNLASGTIALTLSDPDGGPLTLAVASNTNPWLLPTAAIVVGGSGSNRTVTFTAATNRTGTAVVTLRISDGTASVLHVVTVRVGSGAKEVLVGTSGTDVIFGRGGRDLIDGRAGDDLLCGGGSGDWMLGGDGNDVIGGQNGDDLLDGGSGDDQLDGGSGNDALLGRTGNDTLRGGSGRDFFSGGPGTDVALDFNPAAGDRGDGTTP